MISSTLTGIEDTLEYLDRHEIDYRLVSNHCCGYIFYFLDGSVYPRRFHDAYLDSTIDVKIIAESTEGLLKRVTSTELTRDWRVRIEGDTLAETFAEVREYIKSNQ